MEEKADLDRAYRAARARWEQAGGEPFRNIACASALQGIVGAAEDIGRGDIESLRGMLDAADAFSEDGTCALTRIIDEWAREQDPDELARTSEWREAWASAIKVCPETLSSIVAEVRSPLLEAL